MDYFSLATELARAEGAKTLAGIAAKAVALRSIAEGTSAPCHCSAYNFPHYIGRDNCPGVEPDETVRARIAFNNAYAEYFK